MRPELYTVAAGSLDIGYYQVSDPSRIISEHAQNTDQETQLRVPVEDECAR
jgi:hypothetical protein